MYYIHCISQFVSVLHNINTILTYFLKQPPPNELMSRAATDKDTSVIVAFKEFTINFKVNVISS